MDETIGSPGTSPEVPASCQGCSNLDVAVDGSSVFNSCLIETAYFGLSGQTDAPTTEWVQVAMRRADEAPNLDPQVAFGRRAQNANTDCPITARAEQAIAEGIPNVRVDIRPPEPLLTLRALRKALRFNR